jgi:hypothetical protein
MRFESVQNKANLKIGRMVKQGGAEPARFSCQGAPGGQNRPYRPIQEDLGQGMR